MSDETARQANPFEGVPCRACGAATLILQWRIELKPHGTWSLAGVQPKSTGEQWPWCVCTTCGAESRGKRA